MQGIVGKVLKAPSQIAAKRRDCRPAQLSTERGFR